MQLPSTPRSVRLARDQAGRTLHDWGYAQETIDRLLLVCSELATNAVRHGHERDHLFEVRLHDEGASCLVQVSDAASRRLPHCVKAEEDDEHGRGLELVSARHGVLGRAWPPRTIGSCRWAGAGSSRPWQEICGRRWFRWSVWVWEGR
ncbi:ATP-binding protein [Streptomyces sp. NPDC007983]|uniref:ATP-binding protein n=1 Tax=Streptomyces sp. NPDC007983 TaxID=3364800 RepID=UPI0036E006E0